MITLRFLYSDIINCILRQLIDIILLVTYFYRSLYFPADIFIDRL